MNHITCRQIWSNLFFLHNCYIILQLMILSMWYIYKHLFLVSHIKLYFDKL